QYGNSPWIFDQVSQQWVNGSAQNLYAGFTDGQTVPTTGIWTDLPQIPSRTTPQQFWTSRAKRTSYATAQYAIPSMIANGKAYVGKPVWPAAWNGGVQN